MMLKQHVFIIGSKSMGAYGGYETFVSKLTAYHCNENRIQYHIACKANGDGSRIPEMIDGAEILNDKEFLYNNAYCFRIGIPEKLGSAQAIYYDCKAFEECIRIIETQHIEHPIVYILACRIGPFVSRYYRKIKALGGQVYLNPDGHEWMRAKWSAPIRKYWKISEQMMVKWSDFVICDSVNIEKYIHETYDGKGIGGRDPKTTFIAYGAETRKSELTDDAPMFTQWLAEKGLTPNEYYLVVGRFVPENNFEIMIREFMKSHTRKNFAIITTINEKFTEQLEERLHFREDNRIKFVGTVYDQELLMKIRENAYGYFHGHEVGGTNPSLLEALGSTKLNLLLNVGFNSEVAEDAALYWTKEAGNLAALIERADNMTADEIEVYGKKSTDRINQAYCWEYIGDRYLQAFGIEQS